MSAIAADQELCIGAVQRPRPESLASAIVVRGDSPNRKPADLVGKKVAVNQAGAGKYLLLKPEDSKLDARAKNSTEKGRCCCNYLPHR
ncbi:hypothetical protein [Nostoc sp. DSM 114159]